MRFTLLLLAMILAGCTASSQPGSQHPLNSSKDIRFSAETYYAAGRFAETQNNFTGAITQYESALQLKPDFPAALYRVGVLYTQRKDYPHAIAAWKKYVQVTHQSPRAYANLGYCYELAGDLTQAEQAYSAGLVKSPNDPACRINYGSLLARQGKIELAEQQWKGILTDAQMHYDLGVVFENQKKIDQARKQYQQALKLDPNLTQAQSRLDQLSSTPVDKKVEPVDSDR